MGVMLTAKELAERWHIGSDHLATLRWKGIGCQYVKIGRRVLYRIADVEQYEQKRTVTEKKGRLTK